MCLGCNVCRDFKKPDFIEVQHTILMKKHSGIKTNSILRENFKSQLVIGNAE